jgi:hypothetical protein
MASLLYDARSGAVKREREGYEQVFGDYIACDDE